MDKAKNKEKPETRIKVMVLNPPTQKEAENKIKELCAYLSANWHTKINSKP